MHKSSASGLIFHDTTWSILSHIVANLISLQKQSIIVYAQFMLCDLSEYMYI